VGLSGFTNRTFHHALLFFSEAKVACMNY
jgi:hypothetical protein